MDEADILKRINELLAWGQTMNADFVKPAALALGLVAKGERFGWHRFRHSLNTWANEITKDIAVSQTLLRHSKPEMTAVYAHGSFNKALEAQRKYMEQLNNCWQRNPHWGQLIDLTSGWHRAGISTAREQQPLASGCAASRC
jgi:urease accessory protein UreH